MSVDISNGRMLVTKGGETRLNTDDAFFHITNAYTGSVNIPNAGVSSINIDTTTVYDLGAANQFATHVIGAVKFTLGNQNAGMAYDRWHSVCGGSICWVMDGEPGSSNRRGSNFGFRQGCFYHFDISGGRCRLVRRLVLKGVGGAQYSILAHRIDYKLRAGAWV